MAELDPLVTPSDLDGFPGAPYAPAVVEAAGDSVRAEANWHIAPEVTETLELDSPGGPLLIIPTLRLLEVTAVHDNRDPENPRELDGWRKTRAGMLYRRQGWPRGFETVRVELRHGYAQCPRELLSVIAERCQRAARDSAVVQESAGTESVSYSTATEAIGAATSSRAVQRYRIQAGV